MKVSKKKVNVFMKPFGKARPRVTRRGTFMPKTYTDSKKQLKTIFGNVPDGDVYALNVVSYRKMPKSWSKKKKADMNGQPTTTRPDIDNIVGAVMDALFDEDSKVVQIVAQKVWGEVDMISIEIATEGAE